MNITYVLPFPELNGGNKVVVQHVELLRRLGHQLNVVGEGPRPDWAQLAAPYHDLAAGRPRLPEQDLVVATYWTTIARACDLDLGPVAHFCQGYEGGLAHLRPRLPEIEAAYARPLPALTVSPHLGQLLQRRFGRDSRPAPPPLDPDFRPQLRRRPRRRPWVAVPGIFHAEVKGVPTALEAVRRLREDGVDARLLRLSILAPEDDERRLLAADRFLVGVPPAVVARWLARCDLLLFPSHEEEGFGLPVLEAMAAGVPVVGSRISSLLGFAAGAAELVPAGEPAAFARAAASLLAQPAAWRRARRLGLRAARRFAPERVASLLDEAVHWARDRALAAPSAGGLMGAAAGGGSATGC